MEHLNIESMNTTFSVECLYTCRRHIIADLLTR